MSKFQGKNCIVTGGAGLIGSYLVEILVENGASVTVIDDLSKGQMKNLVKVKKDIRFIKTNLEDYEQAYIAIEKSDYFFHLASRAYGIAFSITNNIEILMHNEIITNNLIKILSKKPCQNIIIISSSCVYSDHIKELINENTLLSGLPEKANLGYGLAKRFMEEKFKLLESEINCNLKIVRPFNIYGERYKWVGRYSQAIPMLINKILKDPENIEVWGSGNQKRTYIHAKDCANLIAHFSVSKLDNKIINVGLPTSVSINELISKITNLAKTSPKIFHNTNMPEGRFEKKCSDELQKKIMGNQWPEINLQSGLYLMLDWYDKEMNND